MRIRFRGCANNLNRNGQKTEQTLAKRLACDVPKATDTTADPIYDLPEPQVEEILQQTQAKLDTCRNRLSGKRPAHSPQPRPLTNKADRKRFWNTAMMDRLAAEAETSVKRAPGT